MAVVGKFIRPPRFSVCGGTCPLRALSRNSAVGQSYLPRPWIKGVEPFLQNYASKLCSKLNSQRILASSRNLLRMGSILGGSIAVGSLNFYPNVAFAMDALDILEDDHVNPFGESEQCEDVHFFLALTKKFWLPIVLFVTVLMNWDHPVSLAAKVILILLGTRPSPLSVYLFIEQLRRQAMLREPFLYKFRPLHAKQVEVEDYKLFCLAKIELRDQRFALIGILGNWWVLPLTQFQDVISAFRSSICSSLMIFDKPSQL